MSDSIDTPEFTDDQLRSALGQIGAEARCAAFAVGRPVMIVKADHLAPHLS